MLFEKIDKNCIYVSAPELEAFFGVFSLLSGEEVHQECTQIYGAEKIAEWKRRYRFLFETYEAIKGLAPYDLFDIILDCFDEKFTIDSFADYLLSLPKEERIFRMAGWSYVCKVTKSEIKKALKDDEAMDELYSKAQKDCPGYLGFVSFVGQNDRYLKELFSLAKELDSPALQGAIDEAQAAFDEYRNRVIKTLESEEPLECSQILMGKTFHNKGPYEKFFFVGSLLVPAKVMRLFYENGTKHNKQLLICNVRDSEKNEEDTIAALKALSDVTRYQILKLLLKDGPMKGQDIVRELGLAPSTISHHMTELKDSGLITEEPVKTSKYYGISKKRIKEVLDAVKSDFL